MDRKGKQQQQRAIDEDFLCGRLKGLFGARAISPFLVQPLTCDSLLPTGLVIFGDESNGRRPKNDEIRPKTGSGYMAQLVELAFPIPEVRGSNPVICKN